MGLRELFDFSFRQKKKLPVKDVGVDTYREMAEESGGKYIVHCAENLFWLAMRVNERGDNFLGKTIQLRADIDLSGRRWVPIGKDLQTAFCGIFDGCGHCISGLTMTGDFSYAGFFGVIMGANKVITAEVYNLRLSGVRIEGRGSKTYAGGVTGYALEGVRIEKCMVGGSVVGCSCCGGIVGYAEDSVSVRRCYMRGKVGGDEVVGALVGKLLVNSTLINCGNAVNDLYGRPEVSDIGYCDETSLKR